MKVCLLAPANSIHTQKIAYSLKEEGTDVLVISFHKPVVKDINVVYLPPIIPILGKLNYLIYTPKIKKIIGQYNPDILHAHYVSSYGLTGSFLNYHPFIISVWGADIFNFPKKSFLHKYFVRYALKKADFVLSTSEIMALETMEYTDKEIFVTPFGVDCDKFKLKNELKPKDKIIIGTVKTLEPKYGIEYLIRAFKILITKHPEMHLELHIAGKGSLEDRLKKLSKELAIEDKVKFLGFIEHNKVPDVLNTFSVYVAVSIEESESFGVAVLEAEACGVPVVVSNIGGLPEVVKDGEIGFIVPPKNPQATAEAIDKILFNRELYTRFPINARKFVLEKYDWKENFKVITNIYKKAISSKKSFYNTRRKFDR
jgi:glycosyltransferase involved in cell wall biosynthesis